MCVYIYIYISPLYSIDIIYIYTHTNRIGDARGQGQPPRREQAGPGVQAVHQGAGKQQNE